MVYHRFVQIIEKPRTFVKTRRFTGPCRRRRRVKLTRPDRRAA